MSLESASVTFQGILPSLASGYLLAARYLNGWHIHRRSRDSVYQCTAIYITSLRPSPRLGISTNGTFTVVLVTLSINRWPLPHHLSTVQDSSKLTHDSYAGVCGSHLVSLQTFRHFWVYCSSTTLRDNLNILQWMFYWLQRLTTNQLSCGRF